MANTVTLPLKDISIANTIPDLVTRVEEIVLVLNSGVLGGGTGNAVFAESANTANNALHVFGKLEADLNVNSALFANNTTYAFG